MKKIEVYRAVYHCRCGACDPETVYIPVARQREWDGYPHYYSTREPGSYERIMRHCVVVPAPEGAIEYI